MAKATGVFIAIESPVESYAAAHARKLRTALEQAGHEVVFFTFPQIGEPSSYFAEKYRNGEYGLTSEIIPYAGSLFYALDHFEAAAAIREAIAAGKIVLAHKYIGANMVEQGAKLQHPQERRGYFLWLDNLESRVLNAPRPDKTLVISVSASHAQSLDKQPQSTPVEQQIALYSELCDLYPKDFTRIDAERNGKELDNATLQSLLWNQIEPLLPVHEVAEPEPEVPQGFTVERLEGQIPTTRLELDLSRFLADQLTDMGTNKLTSTTNIYIPEYLPEKLKRQYETATKASLEAYQQMRKELGEQAAAVMPLAVQCHLSLQLDDNELEQLQARLLSNELPEAWELGQQILKATREQSETNVNAANIAYQASRQRTMRKLANDLPQQHAASQHDDIKLVSVFPRNEFDLLPAMLFEQSAMPIGDLENAVRAWDFDQKQSALEAYLGERISPKLTPGQALAQARYVWDILCDYQTVTELRKYGVELAVQALTPRYGYQVPTTIEAAGLADDYENCFDQSMALYSQLQAGGYELEAQYVTLMGHKQRWQLAIDGQKLLQLLDHIAHTELGKQLREKLAEVHPTLANPTVQSKVDKNEPPKQAKQAVPEELRADNTPKAPKPKRSTTKAEPAPKSVKKPTSKNNRKKRKQ